MASPCRINSGSVTATANWFATFTFVPLKMARTTVDEVGISDGGYKVNRRTPSFADSESCTQCHCSVW